MNLKHHQTTKKGKKKKQKTENNKVKKMKELYDEKFNKMMLEFFKKLLL